MTESDGPNPEPRTAAGRFGTAGGRRNPRTAPRRFFAGGLIGRDVHISTVSVALLFGPAVLIAGLEIVRVSPLWGFTYGGAVNGVISQLGTTGPAAALMLVATTANVVAGAVVLRLLGAPAFRSPTDLALGGFAAAVVLDAVVLFVLGYLGLFGWPELLAIHVAVGAAWLATRRRRPLLGVPLRLRTVRPAAWWLLVFAVWAGPLIVQLASPAVPFQDVLPNHVAPVEHIRVFGSFSTLTTSPSPIYGPSRLMLGYIALLGQLTTITNLDAVLAEAAFALPLTILMALSMRRLAGELFGGSASFWILLTFPLTFTFMRIPDSRGTVVVFPLAALALSTISAELRARKRSAGGRQTERSGARDTVGRRSHLPDLALAFALGGGFLVHPLIGLVAFTAAVGALILYPTELSHRLLPALVGGAVLALPQVLTMGAIDSPAWVGAALIAGGVGAAFAGSFAIRGMSDRLAFGRRLSTVAIPPEKPDSTAEAAAAGADAARAADIGRAIMVGAAIVALLVVAAWRIAPSGDPAHPSDPAGELMVDFPHLVWLALGGAALCALRLGRGWILLGCGIAAGVAAWTATGFIGYADLTEQAVHYEVPKSVEYWLPVMLAIGAAGALAALCRQRWLGIGRAAAIGAFLLVAMYPLTEPLATNIQIGEHRGAESVGLALREAERGYWGDLGYPDPRYIIDASTQDVVDELRAEEEAGRLGPNTRVLNIANSFQQWASVPVGVFTGAIETSISSSPEVSIHTEGGRLLGFDQLDQQLADGYGYVLLEPANLSADVLAQTSSKIALAGYRQIWSNSVATIYAKP
ncbi:MAG: hypothetical protein ACHQ01_03120 [Candidatus Limnocylindrales bacterium]